MADENAIELLKRGDARFAARAQLDTFRQEIALNFAPVHASWTTELYLGQDFASHLMDGTPLLVARDFIGQVGAMLRPPGKQYFWRRTHLDRLNNDPRTREYLDWRSAQQLRIMTDRVTGFKRATKLADEFFGLFGDAVLSVDLSDQQDSLRVRHWHSKDCVWAIGDEDRPDTITRRERVPARVLRRRFGEKALHEKVRDICEKDPDRPIEIRHEVLPADEYDYYKPGLKRKAGQWASIWFDVENKKVLRESTQRTFRYVVPSWVRPSTWAYGISPATVVALPDSRLIQAQAIAIQNAAEKSIEPPTVAFADTVRGDIRLEANGITWIERGAMGEAQSPIQPIDIGKNFQLGVEALLRTEAQIKRAFYLDILRMPDTRRTKAREEVQFLVDEYIRAALPLFEPIQSEYSEALLYECDAVIEQAGGYDREMPQGLRKEDLTYVWDNPLSEMIERQKAAVVAEVSQLGQAIAALEAAAQQAPSLRQFDAVKSFRDTSLALGAAPWIRDEAESDDAMAEQGESNAMQGAIAAAPNIAKIIDSGVNAAQVASSIPNPAEPGIPLLPMA